MAGAAAVAARKEVAWAGRVGAGAVWTSLGWATFSSKAGGRKKRRGSSSSVIAENRRARHEYEIEDRIEAGLALLGSEVKALRARQADLSGGYVSQSSPPGRGLVLKGVHIPVLPSSAGFGRHPELRDLPLLLRRAEMARLADHMGRRGKTVVPLSLYWSPGGWAKAELGLAAGRRLADKRAVLRAKQQALDKARALRESRSLF